MSRFSVGFSLDDAFGGRSNVVQPLQAPAPAPPAPAPAATPPKSSRSRKSSHHKHKSRHHRQKRRPRTPSPSSESSYCESESSSEESDFEVDAPPVAVLPPTGPVTFVPNTNATEAPLSYLRGRSEVLWPLPPSVTSSTLGPPGEGVAENPWPGPYQGGPRPYAGLTDSRVDSNGLVLNGDLAGTYTDPNTGIVFAAFTNPMPEPKVLRDVPDLQLGKPSRMLEALTGISSVPRPCRQEIVNDFQDAVEGFTLPQGLLEMQVRNEAAQREAREVFFTNREVEAGYNDMHWDGYIGTTYVLRPTFDTQTLQDNDETNTTVLPYRQNPDGNLAIPMYQDGTQWGGPMQPAVEVLAKDKVYGLPHIQADFQVDNARQQFVSDSGFVGLEGYLSSNVGVSAQAPFTLTNLPQMMASEKATRDSTVGANVVNVSASPFDLTRLPQMASERATGDSIIAPPQAMPQLYNVPSSTAAPFSDNAYARDSSYVPQFRMHQGVEANATLPFPSAEFSGDSSVAPGRNQLAMDSSSASQPLLTMTDSLTAKDSQYASEQLRQPYVQGTPQSLPFVGTAFEGDSRMVTDIRTGYGAPTGQATPMFTDQMNTSDSRMVSQIRAGYLAPSSQSTPMFTDQMNTSDSRMVTDIRAGYVAPTSQSTPFFTDQMNTSDAKASTLFRNFTVEDNRNLMPVAGGSATTDSQVAPFRNTYTEAAPTAMPFMPSSTYAGDSTVAPRPNGLQVAGTAEGVSLPVSYSYAADAEVLSRPVNVSGAETGVNLPGSYSTFAGDSTVQSQAVRMAGAIFDDANRSIVPSYNSVGKGGEVLSERGSQIDVGAAFNMPAMYGTDGSGTDSRFVQHYSQGPRNVDNSALQSIQTAAPTYEGDSTAGAQRVNVAHHDMTNGAALLPILSDSTFTEKATAPGRVSNSRTFFWTGQSIVQPEIPMYIQDPDKGDALHAQDMYTDEERRFRRQNAAAQPPGAAEFRNVYESGGGWRKDEMNLWKGRSNGPSEHVISALLENQLQQLAAASQQNRTCLWDASQTAYESDVGC